MRETYGQFIIITRKKMNNKTIIFGIALLLLINIALATPNSLNIQGKLTDTSDKLKTGTFNFSFRIYDNFTNGTNLYETNITATADSRGVYDAILNNIDLPFDVQYFMSLEIDNDGEMSPRVNLTSVPYSFTSNKSRALNTSRDVFVNDNVNLTAAGNIFASGNLTISQRVGIGTSSPNVKLEVNGTTTIGGDLNIPKNDLLIGGGYDAGGITLIGQGNDLGSGQFGKDILLDGDILSIVDVEINESFIPLFDLFSLLGNTTQRFLDVFVVNIKAGNETLTLDANVSIRGNLSVDGNASIDGTTLFVDAESNRVGIGTSSPSELLQVSGGNILLSNNRFIAFQDSILGTRETLGYNGANSIVLKNDISQVSTAVAINFSSDVSGIQSTKMVILAGGNIGIGTTAPTEILVVAGNANVTTKLSVGQKAEQNVDLEIADTTPEFGITESDQTDPAGRFQIYAVSDILRIWRKTTGDMMAFDGSTGNVGIGTTTPNDALEVIGSVRVSDSLNATSINASTITIKAALLLGWTNLTTFPAPCSAGQFMTAVGDEITCASPAETASAAGGWSNTSDDTSTSLNVIVNFGTFYVNTTDNVVGINNINPKFDLDVIGDVRISGDLNASLINATRLIVNQTLFVNDSRVGIGTSSPDGTLHVNTGSAGSVTASSEGDNLVVEDNGGVGFTLLAPDASDTNIFFGSASSSTNALIRFNRDALLMTIGTATANSEIKIQSGNQGEAIRIDSNQNIGIGTASPATLLDVQGKLNVTGNVSIAQDTLFVDNTSSRIGIGTAAPERTLHVVNVEKSLIIFETTKADDKQGPILRLRRNSASPADDDLIGAINFEGEDDSSNAEAFASINAQIKDTTDTTEDGDLYFSTMQAGTITEVMRIDSSGNVGIGTTTPTDRLQVMGNFSIRNQSDASKVFLFVSNATGRVGIGTTSPDTPFHVKKNVQIVATIESAEAGGAGAWLRLFHDDTTDSRWELAATGSGAAPGAGAFAIHERGAIEDYRFVIAPGGNIGIGDTDPDFSLEVVSNFSVSSASGNDGDRFIVNALGMEQ